MRKLLSIFLVLAISLTAGAATITYTDSVTGLFDLVPDTDLLISQFDPSLGTLNSITIDLSTALQGSVGFENLKKFGGSFDITTSGVIAYIILGLDGSGGIIVSNYTDNQTYTLSLGAFDGTIDYAGTSGTTLANFSDADTQTLSLSDASFLAQFIGTGDMIFNTTTMSMNAIQFPSNGALIVNTTGQASVSITYDYTPVPEPATIALLCLSGLLLKKRK